LDGLVVTNRRWRAVGDHGTLVQHDHPVGDVHDDVHVVFDQQDRVVPGHVLDQRDDLVDTLRGDPGVGLVE